jgi:hypothetical protein
MSSFSEAWSAGVCDAVGVVVFKINVELVGVSVLKDDFCELWRLWRRLPHCFGVAKEVVSVRSAEIVSIGFLFLSVV